MTFSMFGWYPFGGDPGSSGMPDPSQDGSGMYNPSPWGAVGQGLTAAGAAMLMGGPGGFGASLGRGFAGFNQGLGQGMQNDRRNMLADQEITDHRAAMAMKLDDINRHRAFRGLPELSMKEFSSGKFGAPAGGSYGLASGAAPSGAPLLGGDGSPQQVAQMRGASLTMAPQIAAANAAGAAADPRDFPQGGAPQQGSQPAQGDDWRYYMSLSQRAMDYGLTDEATAYREMATKLPSFQASVARGEADARNLSNLQYQPQITEANNKVDLIYKPKIAGAEAYARLPAENAATDHRTQQAIAENRANTDYNYNTRLKMEPQITAANAGAQAAKAPPTIEERDQRVILGGDPNSPEYAMSFNRTFMTPRFVPGTDAQGNPTIVPIMPPVPPNIRRPTYPGAMPPAPAPGARQFAPAPGGPAMGGAPAPTAAPVPTAGGPSAGQPIVIGQAKGGGTTEDQNKSRQLYSTARPQADIALQFFDELARPAQVVRGSIPMIGSAMQSEGAQRATNAILTLSASYLYSVSGATANPSETANQARSITPALGDAPGTLADKKARLQQMVESIKLRAQLGIAPGAPMPANGQPAAAAPSAAAPVAAPAGAVVWKRGPNGALVQEGS